MKRLRLLWRTWTITQELLSCDIDIIIRGIVTASLQGEFDEESFKMISTSPENNFNINPITVEDGL